MGVTDDAHVLIEKHVLLKVYNSARERVMGGEHVSLKHIDYTVTAWSGS
jgi:hypothetical protein